MKALVLALFCLLLAAPSASAQQQPTNEDLMRSVEMLNENSEQITPWSVEDPSTAADSICFCEVRASDGGGGCHVRTTSSTGAGCHCTGASGRILYGTLKNC